MRRIGCSSCFEFSAMTFNERLVADLKRFLTFLFNKDTSEILGRTCFSWSKLLLFYLVFYLFFTGIFAIHLSAFLAVTPDPGKDSTPWNFGKYAYPNYPNSKIALVSVPKVITYRQGYPLVLDHDSLKSINSLLPSANASGVSGACLSGSTAYGYGINQPCIFLHIARVFHWTPNLINDSSSLSSEPSLPIICSFESSQSNLVINITSDQDGIPLNLTNSDSGTSFPYSGQANYSTPIMAVTFNLTSLPPDLPLTFSASITCGIDFNSLGWTKPSESRLKRLYEVPDNVTIRVNFRL